MDEAVFEFGYEPSFRSDQLELIIDNYLGLFPYSTHLLQILSNKSIFTFTEVCRAINSAKFYTMVPLNMSSLLTTTNIRIVIAVLRVVGEKGTQMVTQRIGKIKQIRMAITLLTIYQRENNLTNLPEQLTIINEVLKHADILITPNLFSKYRPVPKVQQGRLQIDQLIPVVAHGLSIQGIRRKLIANGDPKDKFRSVRIRQMGIQQIVAYMTKCSNGQVQNTNMNTVKTQQKEELNFQSDQEQAKPNKVENFSKMILNGYLQKIQVQKQLQQGTAEIIDDIQQYQAMLQQKEQCETSPIKNKPNLMMSLTGFRNMKKASSKKENMSFTKTLPKSQIKKTEESTRAATKLISLQENNKNDGKGNKLYDNFLKEYKQQKISAKENSNKEKLNTKAIDFVRNFESRNFKRA